MPPPRDLPNATTAPRPTRPDLGKRAPIGRHLRPPSGARPLRHRPGCCTRCHAAGAGCDGPGLSICILGTTSPSRGGDRPQLDFVGTFLLDFEPSHNVVEIVCMGMLSLGE